MKRFITALAIFGLFAFGTETQAQVNFGLRAGLNVSNISQNFKESDFEYDTKMLFGFHFGVIADFELTDEIGFQPGLLYSTKGYNYDLEQDLEEGETVDGYWRTTFNYIEIPLHFAYKINDFQIFAGPYLGIGLGGKSKWDATYKFDGDTEVEKGELTLKPVFGEYKLEDIKEDEVPFNAIDFGVNLGVGYQVGPALINLYYSLGLGNLTPKAEGTNFEPKDWKESNRVIGLSVSYLF